MLESMGKVDYGRKFSERANVKFRRSLYFVKDLKAGDVITADEVRSVRPGFGLAPKFINLVVGRVVNKNVRKATAVSHDLINYT